jgi:hypothetical protein
MARTNAASVLPSRFVSADGDDHAVSTPELKERRDLGSTPSPVPISLVLIEDNRLLREGIAVMIHTRPGFKVVAASADVEEALQKVR